MSTSNDKDVEELLKQNKELLQFLEKLLSRLKLDVKDQKQFIREVATNILSTHGNVSTEDLKNPQFQKSLCVALLAEHVNSKNPEFKNKFNYKNLFKPDPNKKLNSKKLEEELKAAFIILLLELNKRDPKNKLDAKQINAIAAKMAADAVKNYMSKKDQYAVCDNDRAISSMLVALYGVAVPGETPKTTLSMVGLLYPIPALRGGQQASNTFMDAINRYDGAADPQGIKNQNREREEGILCGFLPELGKLIEKSHEAPHLVMPGTQTH